MRTYAKVLHLFLIATMTIIVGLLVGAVIWASNEHGPSPFTSAAVTSSVCPEAGGHPAERLMTGEPLPFNYGIRDAAGEHNLP
jgi:hypothetical protein